MMLHPPAQRRSSPIRSLFGYTNEELHLILAPMANGGAEGVGSMGHDAAHRGHYRNGPG